MPFLTDVQLITMIRAFLGWNSRTLCVRNAGDIQKCHLCGFECMSLSSLFDLWIYVLVNELWWGFDRS